jgi:aldose 1-epimerase
MSADRVEGPAHRTPFGTLPDRGAVEAFLLRNAHGASVNILTLGGIIQSFVVPDRAGNFTDVALGYPDLEHYAVNQPHFGALIGRYANRIANGRFTLDGKSCELTARQHGFTLHGGARGFDKYVWTVVSADASSLHLRLESPDGDQGFPGTMRVDARYVFTDETALVLTFEATTSAPTVVNLTNHAYWNLAARGEICDHELHLAADCFTPVDARLLPTGEIASVAGTPFDFREGAVLRPRMMQRTDRQIAIAGGIDHNFVLNGHDGSTRAVARIADPASGRMLQVSTTEPGLHVYTGNSLAGGPPGKWGVPYRKWEGLALETQHFPDSPN